MREEDKMCVLCIDELAIKANLFYNYGRDTVRGVEDDGISRSLTPASTAAVIMARGLKSNWKQPLGYVFTSTTYSVVKTKDLLEKFIIALDSVDLNTIALVTDMGSNFMELSKLLGVTKEKPVFTLGNKEIFYVFDPPHLVKAVRNNMLLNSFCWDDKKTCWQYIVDFYNRDKNLTNRCAPRLTNAHIAPGKFEKMRVKYATQVLSATVAGSLHTYIELKGLPEDATGTMEFVAFFDKLFDIFNSSKLYPCKQYAKPFSGQPFQIEFLQNALEFLQKLKVINAREQMNCMEDFDQLLLNLSEFREVSVASLEIEEAANKLSFAVNNCDYHTQPLPEQNAFKYVCGYLIHKCLQAHKCDVCTQFATVNQQLDDSNLFVHYKAYSNEYSLFGGLKTPHESFYNYIYLLEKVFFSNIEDKFVQPRVGYSLYLSCKEIVGFTHPCTSFPYDYLLQLFVRLRLFYVIKNSNRNFKNTSKKNRKICILMGL
ncbi:hypothetical protein Zmor_028327 [Zophobas morio]|uniref:Transposable element P transposase n=1 Tax=Zophobas morio TaxID=2755281 RepID=A0AA38M3E6_9CUCU|nr:hypothetical protein Zmor_028327 [Zophobas morio]